jgi:hypothetical protein
MYLITIIDTEGVERTINMEHLVYAKHYPDSEVMQVVSVESSIPFELKGRSAQKFREILMGMTAKYYVREDEDAP